MAETDIVDRLLADHADLRRILSEVDTTPPDQLGELFRHLVSELARHEAAEEALVHTAARNASGGEVVAQAVLDEEDQAEKLLADMERMDPTSPEFADAFRRLRADVLAHAEHEERDEFPLLREHLSEARRRDLADAFDRLKQVGPTHPHPLTPQTPEIRAVAGPVAGIFDRARDAARDLFSS